MAITWTETNTTTTKQPGNQHHKEVRMEDQTNLSSMVRRLQAQVSDMCRHLAEETMVLQKENAQLREVIGPNDVKMKPVNHQQTLNEGEIVNASYENHVLSPMQNH